MFFSFMLFYVTELPKPYKASYREILSADPAVVDLHKLGPYYYAFGSLFQHFEHPESPEISKSLLQVCMS